MPSHTNMGMIAAIRNMINRFYRKTGKDAPVVLNLCLDINLYKKLKNEALTNSVSESDELFSALKRGMSDYWLHVIKYDRERYTVIARLFEQAKRDNMLLEAIIKQNEDYRTILKENDSCRKQYREQQQ